MAFPLDDAPGSGPWPVSVTHMTGQTLLLQGPVPDPRPHPLNESDLPSCSLPVTSCVVLNTSTHLLLLLDVLSLPRGAGVAVHC